MPRKQQKSLTGRRSRRRDRAEMARLLSGVTQNEGRPVTLFDGLGLPAAAGHWSVSHFPFPVFARGERERKRETASEEAR